MWRTRVGIGSLSPIRRKETPGLSSDRSIAIEKALGEIVVSSEFSSSPTLQKFLTFIVAETLSGRGHQLKSAVIAQLVLGRDVQDERADNAVRTTAVRLRAALNAYNARQGATQPVQINLPKGRYVPAFVFAETTDTKLHPEEEPPIGNDAFRLKRAVGIGLAVLAVAVSLLVLFYYFIPPHTQQHVQLFVRATDAIDDESVILARRVDHGLAPRLSDIGLVSVVAPGDMPEEPVGYLAFFLDSHADAYNGILGWHISDSNGVILASGREALEDGASEDLNLPLSRMAFQILGEDGALPLLLERRYGADYVGVLCKTRGRLLLRAESPEHFDELRACLDRAVDDDPNDAEVWASLGEILAIRSRYYDAYEQAGYENLIVDAKAAAAMATALAPNAYLTKVARMHVALSAGETWLFLSLQQQLREEYPGDFQLHLRIASRLTRLGEGEEAIAIYENAAASGVSLAGRSAEIAFAYLVAGDVDAAASHIDRVVSQRLYELVLKTAILSKAQRYEDARKAGQELIALYPESLNQFYPWFSSLRWDPAILEGIDKAFADAGFHVARP